jgi:lipopolysaccharide transport system permease protein
MGTLTTSPRTREGPTATAKGDEHLVIIEPRSQWRLLDLHEVWRYRELVGFLALRDIKVRYKQTILGAAWAVLQPLLTMVVFSVFFGKLAKVGSDGTPYPLFAFAALVPWQLFAASVGQVGNSLVSDQGLIKKVYFPRLVVPLAAMLVPVADFLVSLGVLLAMTLAYGMPLGWRVLTIPVLAAFAMVAALSVGIWLAALNVKYRDFRYTIPFLIQIWLFASPVAYSSSIVPERWRLLFGLNPMTGVIDGFRWALLGGTPPARTMTVSLLTVLALLAGGMLHFRRTESTFADVV